MKYRKKPVVIDAIQLKASNIFEILDFITGEQTEINDAYFEYAKTVVKDGYLIINTLEGEMKASIGDYVIKGVQGEFYPCKPDIFEATYEAVNDKT